MQTKLYFRFRFEIWFEFATWTCQLKRALISSMPWDHLLQEELSNGSNYFLATNYPIHSINYLGITRQNTNLLINSTRIPKKWLWVVSRFGLKKSCHLPSIPLYVVQSSQSAGSSMNALKVKIACRSQLTMAVCANFLPKFWYKR